MEQVLQFNKERDTFAFEPLFTVFHFRQIYIFNPPHFSLPSLPIGHFTPNFALRHLPLHQLQGFRLPFYPTSLFFSKQYQDGNSNPSPGCPGSIRSTNRQATPSSDRQASTCLRPQNSIRDLQNSTPKPCQSGIPGLRRR